MRVLTDAKEGSSSLSVNPVVRDPRGMLGYQLRNDQALNLHAFSDSSSMQVHRCLVFLSALGFTNQFLNPRNAFRPPRPWHSDPCFTLAFDDEYNLPFPCGQQIPNDQIMPISLKSLF